MEEQSKGGLKSSMATADPEIDIDFVDKLLTESIRLKKKCKVSLSLGSTVSTQPVMSMAWLLVIERISQGY